MNFFFFFTASIFIYPMGNHDLGVGSLVRRMTNMSKWSQPEVVKNQDPEEHLD